VNVGTFTPDGRSIVFSAMHAGQSHLWEMAVDAAAEPRQLTFGQGWEEFPDVSPDGRLVAFNVNFGTHELFAQPLSGGSARRLTSSVQQLA